VTIIHVLYVYCDTDDCENGNNAGLEGRPGQTRTDLRADMRSNGWRRIGGKDYCPECVAEMKPLRRNT